MTTRMPDRDDIIERIHEAIDVGVCVDLFMDILELLKEQKSTIKELQNAYGYLQKKFFEVQDDLLKEQEKKPGEWIYKHDNLWYCSRCGEIIYSTNTDDLEIHHAYCSRCGAKMKQEGR